MFLLDSLLIDGLGWVFDKVRVVAESEMDDESGLRESLLEAQTRLESGEISEAESSLLGLCCTSFGARVQQKERSGVTAVWQWDVSDSFRMTVDGLFTRLDAPTVGYHQSFYVEDSILDEGTGLHRWSDVSITDHWVDGMTIAELVPEISTITEYRVVDTTQFGWNGSWDASDRLHFSFDAYTSEAERKSGGKDTWVVSGIGGSHVGRVDMNNNALPDISVTLDDGRDFATALANRELGDDDFGLHYIGLSGTDLDCQKSAGAEMVARTGEDCAVRIETVRAAVERIPASTATERVTQCASRDGVVADIAA